MTLKYRFERNVRKEEDGCWIWLLAKNEDYGRIKINKIKYQVHRVSMYLYKEFKLNSDKFILHKCKNKKCVNPDHLYIGDHYDNMRDMTVDKTHRNTRKTHCPQGHEYIHRNTLINSNSGARVCRICHREKEAERKNDKRD